MADLKNRLVDGGLLWLRILMGAGIASHGYAKIFSGGVPGFSETVGKMGLPFPLIFAWLAALSEFGGGLLIFLGLFTRPAAFFVLVNMSVAAFLFHSADPFSVKELALAYWTMAGTLLLAGGGSYSMDTARK